MADLSGFNKKMEGLLQVAKAMRSLPNDAVAFAHEKMANELLNLPQNAIHPDSATKGAGIIRRITGGLVGSMIMSFNNDGSARLWFNTQAKDYIIKVNEYSERHYGMGYLQLFVSFYREEIERKIKAELTLAIHSIRDGQLYKYGNPFPKSRPTRF